MRVSLTICLFLLSLFSSLFLTHTHTHTTHFPTLSIALTHSVWPPLRPTPVRVSRLYAFPLTALSIPHPLPLTSPHALAFPCCSDCVRRQGRPRQRLRHSLQVKGICASAGEAFRNPRLLPLSLSLLCPLPRSLPRQSSPWPAAMLTMRFAPLPFASHSVWCPSTSWPTRRRTATSL